MLSYINLVLELTKFRIAVMSTVSTAAGYVASGEALGWKILPTALGTLLLACGTLAMNQYQERDVDSIMERTKGRPLPTRRISPGGALAVSAFFLLAGSVVLMNLAGPIPAMLGWVSVVWYNLVYTPLKKRTAFAVIPGSLIGAIPPAIGWTAAGGSLADPGIWAIAFFFFIWQVPHFWLLLFKYGKQYEKASLASMTSVFTTEQMTRITFIWICATAIGCLTMPLFGAVQTTAVTILLAVSGGLLILKTVRILKPDQPDSLFRSAFMAINFYALAVMALISIDRFVRQG